MFTVACGGSPGSGSGADTQPCAHTDGVADSATAPAASSDRGDETRGAEAGTESATPQGTTGGGDDTGSSGGEVEDPPPQLDLCSPSQGTLRPGERFALDPIDGPPIVVAQTWAVADASTGEVVYGCRVDEQRDNASTTKIMTAWIVLDLAVTDPALLGEEVIVSAEAAATGGTSAGLIQGEAITVSDLLYGLMLPSGNDAAVALAEHVGGRFPGPGGVEGFVTEMNERAADLGLLETVYLDPHGNSANQSSARDLVALAMVVMENERFREIVAARQHPALPASPRWTNTNALLSIEAFDGIKTGWTGGAGGCLVSRGSYEGDQLVVVVMGSERDFGRFVDSRNLFGWAWRDRLGP